jgi:thiol-disulfide isomerase/thioredoxin
MLVGAGLLTFGIAALFLLPGLLPAGSPQPISVIPVKLDFPAPDLELADFQGKPVSLAGLRGQVVLVNNWATWCPPCKAEMPTLEAYYRDHRDQNFSLVAIESGSTAQEVSAFVQSMELTFPVWLDPAGVSLERFSNFALPNSYIIDSEGSVVLGWSGAIDRKTLEKYVTPILEGGS